MPRHNFINVRPHMSQDEAKSGLPARIFETFWHRPQDWYFVGIPNEEIVDAINQSLRTGLPFEMEVEARRGDEDHRVLLCETASIFQTTVIGRFDTGLLIGFDTFWDEIYWAYTGSAFTSWTGLQLESLGITQFETALNRQREQRDQGQPEGQSPAAPSPGSSDEASGPPEQSQDPQDDPGPSDDS